MAGTVQLTSNLPRVLELPPPPPRVAAAGQKRAREVDKAQRKAEKKAAKRAKKEAKKVQCANCAGCWVIGLLVHDWSADCGDC